jgi:ATP-binding cassette subfamily B protein
MHGRPATSEDAGERRYDHRLMRRVMAFVAPYKKLVLVALLSLAVIRLASLVPPYLIKEAVDRHLRPESLSVSERLNGVRILAALFFSVLILKSFATYANSILTASLGHRVMRDLRVAVFAHLQRMSMDFLAKNPVGRLMTRVTSDIETLNEMLTSGIVALIGDMLSLVGVLVLMAFLDVEMTVVSLTVLPALYFSSKFFRKAARLIYKEIRGKVAALNAYLQENIAGMRIVQLFRRERENRKRFEVMNRDLFATYLRGTLYTSIFFPFVNVVGSAAKALAIWYGAGEIIQSRIELGTLIAFMSYLDSIFHPLSELAEKYNMILSAMASSERVFGLLDTQPTVPTPATSLPVDPFLGRIEFRNVWFTYDADAPGNKADKSPAGQTRPTSESDRLPTWVLRDLSFAIEPGEKIALVGTTGAGKSSIVNLVCRFYDASRGKVLIDGKDVRLLHPQELRARIAVVLQDIFLFSGDIDYNIRLGNETIPRENAREAARMVNAHLFIEKLPGVYAAEVKERGATLSIGQRQLLSFARALAYDPRLIILDEATSSVDTETELLIQDALQKLLAGRTAIIVAHRLSTIKKADRIFVMHHGELREVGTHAELLAKRDIYYRLYRLQAGG